MQLKEKLLKLRYLLERHKNIAATTLMLFLSCALVAVISFKGNFENRNRAAFVGNTLTVPGNVRVDFTTPIRTISPLAIGIAESTYGRGGHHLTLDDEMRSKLTQLGVQQMRIELEYAEPGNTASAIQCGASGCPAGISGDAWVEAIVQIGAEPLVIVPLDAEEAAGLVRHFNFNTEYRIGRWLIGNEPDTHHMTAEDYSSKFNEIYDAMKEEDPTIQIGGPATAYFNKDFIAKFLSISGTRVDFLDYHAYGQGGAIELNEFELMRNTPKFDSNYEELHNLVVENVPQREKDIGYQIGEWNLDWDGDPKQFTQFNTVWGASVVGHLLKTGTMSVPYATKNGDLGVLFEYQSKNAPDSGYVVDDYLPLYHGIGIFTGEGLYHGFGSQLVNTATSLSDIEIYASDQPKRIIAINKHPVNNQNAVFSMTGMQSGKATVWSKDTTMNPNIQPVNVGELTFTNGTFSVNLPPYSVSAFVLTALEPTSPLQILVPTATSTPTPTSVPTPTSNTQQTQTTKYPTPTSKTSPTSRPTTTARPSATASPTIPPKPTTTSIVAASKFVGIKSNQTVSGEIFVTYLADPSKTKNVKFYFDNATKAYRTESRPPYALNGDSNGEINGYNTKKLKTGTHTLRVEITDQSGKVTKDSIAFTVKN